MKINNWIPHWVNDKIQKVNGGQNIGQCFGLDMVVPLLVLALRL